MPDPSHPFDQPPSRQVTTSPPNIDTLHAERYPNLGIALGAERPMRQGLLREYIPVDGGQ
jgi:hypothetical protein